MVTKVRSRVREWLSTLLAAAIQLRPVKKKKVRGRPPWWCRTVLAAALWPRPELYEYARKFHREYVLRVKHGEIREANEYARHVAWQWALVARWRLFRVALSVASVIAARIARS